METKKRKPNTILMAFGLICGLLAGTGTLPGCGKGEMDVNGKASGDNNPLVAGDCNPADLREEVCPEDFLCVNGRCLAEGRCIFNTDCDDDERCDTADDNYRCLDVPCEANPGETAEINPETRECIRTPIEGWCDDDADCDEIDGRGGVCDLQDHRCYQCFQHGDCDPEGGWRCDEERVCREVPRPEPQDACWTVRWTMVEGAWDVFREPNCCLGPNDDAACRVRCNEDTDCGEGEACRFHAGISYCVPSNLPEGYMLGCESDALAGEDNSCTTCRDLDQSGRCEVGELCDNQVDDDGDGEIDEDCGENNDCETDEDCGPDMVCSAGVCLEACNRELPCPEGQYCDLDGTCQPSCQGDVDCDQIPNGDDRCPDMPDNGMDTDDDGFPDACDNCPENNNPEQLDIDGDGLGMACDPGDGMACDPEHFELGVDCLGIPDPVCTPEGQCACRDTDSDLVCDLDDNCDEIPNQNQADIDDDDRGDACDPVDDRLCQNGGPNCLANDEFICVAMQCMPDPDNDDIPTDCPQGAEGCMPDNCPNVANNQQVDSDGDLIGDACDNCPNSSNVDQADNDGDMMGNACDVCPNFVGNPNSCNACEVQQMDICDGRDNDCNGTVDDNNPGGGQPCNTGVAGICGDGLTRCAGEDGIVCVQVAQPQQELCNQLDDNCNGQTDEAFPELGQVCTLGLGQCLANGTYVCAENHLGVTCNAQPGQPVDETCNGLDDDCDGSVDEGNPGGGAACNTGLQGICAQGTQTCQNGAIQCVQNMQPAAEICSNAIDEDCNGADLACQQAPDLRGRMNNGESGILSHPDGTPDNIDNDGDCYCETAPCVGSVNPACGALQGNDCDETCDNQGGNPLTGSCSGFGNNPNAGDWDQDRFDNNCDGVIKCLDNSFCMNGNQCINGTCQLPPQ